MNRHAMTDITALLVAARHGDRQALDRLMPLVYDRLRSLARARVRRERPDHTLDSAALVHEAYLKLVRVEHVEWQDRAHFFAIACRLMRRVLLDHAERRGASKRAGGLARVELDSDLAAAPTVAADDLVILHAALEQLDAVSPRACRAVECRHFGGLSVEEIAADLHVSPATVKRDLRFGQAWLARAMKAAGAR
jgi:RNA polymerase sigma factor (TIGR02999 family)